MPINDQTIILEVMDGERLLSVHIPRMDCIAAETFLLKFATVLARAGLKIPGKKIDTQSLIDSASEAIANTPEGMLLQLRDLKYDEVDELRKLMLQGCMISMTDDASGKTVKLPLTDQNIRANISEVKTLFQIRLAVLKHNFGFLLGGSKSDSKRQVPPSGLSSMLIAPRLSPS